LKEYLQLFAEKSTARRTLVLFYYFVGMEDREILYNLQMEKNVDVVIVTMHSYTIDYLKQFPRHLKFTVSSDSESILNSKNLLDVIKNPQFDRFEFEKN